MNDITVCVWSYTYEDEEGVFPETQFVFDLELPAHFKPRVGDGEVQEFYFMRMDKVDIFNDLGPSQIQCCDFSWHLQQIQVYDIKEQGVARHLAVRYSVYR